MIISHKHKFIFLHTPKTGGSSISASLIQTLGKEDKFIGGIKEAYEMDKLPILSYLWSIKSPIATKTIVKSLIQKNSPENILSNAGKAYYNSKNLNPHSGWKDIKDHVGSNIWDDYYTFTFERNPWDKLVSMYHWRGRNHDLKNYPFELFVDVCAEGINLFTGEVLPNLTDWDMYADKNNVKVDYIGKFENILQDFEKILDDCDLNLEGWLPHTKSNYRKKKSYKQYYNNHTRKVVEDLFHREINYFSYTF